MRDFDEVLGFLKRRLELELGPGVRDSDVARELNTRPQRLSDWKARGTIPWEHLAHFAHRRGWTVDAIVYGDELAAESSPQYGPTPQEQELLTLYRSLPAEDRRYVVRLIRGLVMAARANGREEAKG